MSPCCFSCDPTRNSDAPAPRGRATAVVTHLAIALLVLVAAGCATTPARARLPIRAPLSHGGASTLAEFTTSMAALDCDSEIQPCCASRKVGYDKATCTARRTANFAALFGAIAYDPVKGEACLDEYANAADIGMCSADTTVVYAPGTCGPDGMTRGALEYGPACGWAFNHTHGAVPLGGNCDYDDQKCAWSPEGPVRCDLFFVFGPGFPTATVCEVVLPGHDGDPCDEFNLDTLADMPTAFHTCVRAEGLYCDRTNHTCAPLGQVGDSCANEDFCVCASFCSDGRCVPRPALGESCFPGANTFDNWCTDGLYCDATAKVCVPQKPIGAACVDEVECVAPYCEKGVCTGSGQNGDELTAFCGG